eukprot:7601967-Lingulodinium_polyedra.AAC.1
MSSSSQRCQSPLWLYTSWLAACWCAGPTTVLPICCRDRIIGCSWASLCRLHPLPHGGGRRFGCQ